MKKLFLLLALFGFVAVGCSDPDDGGTTGGDNYLTFINNSNINPSMVAGGGMVNITFTTEYDWSITSNADWLSASKSNGFAGIIDFFITASPNKTETERKGVVTISLAEVKKEYKIRVTQAPNEGIKHLVCQDNEILYTTKYNYKLEKNFLDASGFGDGSISCVESGYDKTYGYLRFTNDVTKIPANAFAGCTSMEIIYLPDGIKEIGQDAFAGCTALHSIYSINSIDNYKAVVINGALVAVAPAELTEYTVPAGVTKIGAGAFSGCKTLTKVVIPEGVKEIEAGAFNDCESLSYVEIPNSLTTFGGDIFTGKCNTNVGCYVPPTHPNWLIYLTKDNNPLTLNSYENIMFENHDGEMGDFFYIGSQILPNQFRGCTTLTEVLIPSTITSIGENAFYNCTSLTSVYCAATTPPSGAPGMFDSNASRRYIYVPRYSVSAYKSAEYWRDYADYIIGGDF